MTARRRRLAGLILGVLLFACAIAVSVLQIRVADQRGWAGMTFIPRVHRPGKVMFGWSYGEVIILFPDSPADHAGVRHGDIVLDVDGVSSADMQALDRLDAKVKTGDVVVYHVSRAGREMKIPVRYESPLRSMLFIPPLVISAFVSLVFIAIGSFVFWRRPDDRRVRIFYSMTVVAAIYILTAVATQITNGNQRGITEEQSVTAFPQLLFFGAAMMLFAPLLLHLALIFPKPRPVVGRRPEIFRWVYGPPFVFAAAMGWSVLCGMAVKHPVPHALLLAGGGAIVLWAIVRLIVCWRRRPSSLFRREALTTQTAIVGTFFVAISLSHVYGTSLLSLILSGAFVALCTAAVIAYPVATVMALYRSYKESGVEEKRQVKWPLWATMVVIVIRGLASLVGGSIGLFGMLSSHHLVGGTSLQLLTSAPTLVYILIPLSFAFAIVKYRLMNIDVIIRRTVLYATLTAIVFAVYAALVAGLGTLLVRFAGLQNQTMIIASTIVVALVAVPLRNRLQTVVDRSVFRERIDQPLALRTIDDAIDRGAPRNELLRILAEQLQQALQNRFVITAMRNERHFVVTAKVGVADELVGTTRVPVEQMADAARIPGWLRRLGTELIVPMRVQGAMIGFVALGAKLSKEDFSHSDHEFLDSAVSRVAMSVESARLKTEEEEFEQTRAMQQVLLPKSLPQLDRISLSGAWQPARSVGGDYYDAIPLGEEKAAICIADVAGKGMPAALLMAGLQAAVKATASLELSPGRLCERVRQVIATNLAGGTFITFFYAVLDAKNRTLAYCNAGHNPPLLLRANGEIERLATGGSVLGRLFVGDPYQEATLTLGAGDRVVLFTDGVTESRRGDEDFGEERLIDVVRTRPTAPAGELQNAVLEAISSFTAGSFGDDVTLVVIAAE